MRNIILKTSLFALFASLMYSPSLYAANPFSDDSVILDEKINVDANEAFSTEPGEYTLNPQTKGEYPCEGTVNCRYGQNCRNSPWGDVVTILPPKTKVTVTGKEGDWYTIEYNGQKCYLHYSLVDTPTTPAYDGYHPYAYAKENPKYNKTQVSKSSNDSNSGKSTNNGKIKTTSQTKPLSNVTTSSKKIDTSKSINGPEVPNILMKGLEEAKKSVWNRTNNKCLQFAGTIAEEAGAKVSKKGAGSQPQIAWAKTKDTSLRGQKISDLKQAALTGKLLPGMLIHVKAHYNEDPDYKRSNDGHHWFMYMGLVNGEPMFVDNIKGNQLRNTETQAKTFNNSKYGERRITTIYDPFADQR